MKLRSIVIAIITSAVSFISFNDSQAQVRARITLGQPVYERRHYHRVQPVVRPYYGYRHDKGLHRGWYKNNRGWERKDLYDSRDRSYNNTYHRNYNKKFDHNR